MNQRAVTWGDLLDRRSGSHFVGRRREVEAFRLNCLYDVPQSLLFVLQGPPGIGKTALLSRYGTIAREHGVVTATISCCDIRLGGRFSIIEVMAALGRQLAQAGVPLTTFQEVLKEYHTALEEIDPTVIAKDPTEIARSVEAQAPGHVWAIFGGASDDDAWVQRAWDEYLVSAASVRWSRLIKDPIAILTDRFVQDLNAWATVRKIVLSLDDWHLKPAAIDGWLQGLLLQGELSTNIWLALATRRSLTSGWERLSAVTFAIDMLPLSRSDSRALLLANEVAHVPALEQRLDLGRGNPLALIVLSRTPGTPLSQPSFPPGLVSQQDNVSRAISGYLTALAPRWREIFLKGSAARHLDAELLRVLFSGSQNMDLLADSVETALSADDEEVEGVARILAFLAQSPLTASSATGLRWHPAAIEPVAQWAQADAAYAWRNAHQRLSAYYRQRVELHGEGRQYLDSAWQRDQTEALYHSLVLADLAVPNVSSSEADSAVESTAHLAASAVTPVDGVGNLVGTVQAPECAAALNAVLLSFAEGCLYFRPWADSVIRLWQDAAQISNPVGPVAVWLAEVEALSGALFAGDWERAMVLLDDLIGAIGYLSGEEVASSDRHRRWSPDTLQALRNLRQLAASRLALHPKSGPDLGTPVEGLLGDEPEPVAVSETGDLDQDGVPRAEPHTASVACSLSDDLDDAASETATPEEGEMAVEGVHGAQAGQTASPRSGQGTTDTTVREDNVVTSQAETSAVEHCHYANTRLDDADYETAIQAYDQALALNPTYVAAYYNRGLAYARMGTLDLALADFTRVIELDPSQATAYHQRGLAYVRKGAFKQAVADYNAALTLSPGSIPLLYARANAYFRMNAYERAIADYTAVLAQDKSRSDAFLNRGLAHVAMDNYLDGLRDYNQAIALDPERAVAFSRRGQVYVYLARYTEALVDYERAVSLNPRDAGAYNDMGLLYVRIEAYPQAIEAYQHAMALQPDWATPYYNAACAVALAIDDHGDDSAIDRACVWLSRAVALRERYRAMALTDPDFAKIRESPQFRSIVDL